MIRALRGVPRAIEAGHLIFSLAADSATRQALLTAYSCLLSGAWSGPELTLRIAIHGRVETMRIRRRDIYILGELLHEEPYALGITLPPRPTIVDAGANIGLATLWLRSRHPDASFHCIEPATDNFRLLQLNVGAFATCEHAALGARNEEVELTLQGGLSDNRVNGGSHGMPTERVPCLTGEDYMKLHGLGTVHLLKLDVEGYEIEVLRGFGSALARVGAIVGEVHERMIDEAAFYQLLREHGFEVTARRSTRNSAREGVHMFAAINRAATPAA